MGPKLSYTQNYFNRGVLQYWTEEDLVWQILSFELIIYLRILRHRVKQGQYEATVKKILTLDIHEGLILLPNESTRLPNPSFPLWVNEVVY